MRKWQLITATTVGIMASGSGFIQANAATYNFSVNFSTKEVANFDNFTPTFLQTTNNLELELSFYFAGTYRFDACPTNFSLNVNYSLQARANATGSFVEIGIATLPDFICTTTNTSYFANIKVNINSNYLDLVVNDDANFIQFSSAMVFLTNTASLNRVLYLLGYRFYFDMTYDFGTTYLFNYFLSDQNYDGRFNGAYGSWFFTTTPSTYLAYVYTTAGDDTYFILNSDVTSIGVDRKKYAVDYNMEYFRGRSVGAGFTSDFNGFDVIIFPGVTGAASLSNRYSYYYLNTSNNEQAIVDVPEFNFEYEDCGSFLALNVGCFINNGLAYITNDAPIISDAITLLNAGMQMAGQAFGVIGSFTQDNVFGVLVLGGLGITAVRWFLKND